MSSFCRVSDDRAHMLTVFGTGMLCAAIISIATGKTYFRRVVVREEEPLDFWATVASMLFLAAFTLGGVWFCPGA